MSWLRSSPALFLALHVAQAAVTVDCPDVFAQVALNAGIDDAIKVASNALAMFNDPSKQQLVLAHLLPFFFPSEANGLKAIYQKVKDIKSSPLQVTFFCNEDHLTYRTDLNSWIDQKYTYTSNGAQLPVEYRILDHTNPASPPGAEGPGTSYSTLGFKVKLGDDPNNRADCSNQAHVFIHPDRVRPPAGTQLDTRTFDTIVNNGLIQPFTQIDNIAPLAETVLHELIHVVGGLEDAQMLVGQGQITDGPGAAMYGYEKSYDYNYQRHITGHGVSPLNFADPINIVAKMLYLQIKTPQTEHGFTLWSTGTVDPNTLWPPPAVTTES